MILGVDIGGTAVKMGLVDSEGRIHARHEASVSFDGYRTPILKTVLKETERFLQKEKAAVEGIGVSAAGQIDENTGVVIGTNGKIPGYEGSRIKEEMEKAFSVPTFVLNDANAAVLGECFAGRAKGADPVLMLTLGTGVGGGIVLGGKVFGGFRGIAGEMGHFTLYQDGSPCACGKRGCYENYAATTALVRMAREETGEEEINGRLVFERAEQGDGAMLRILEKWTEDIAAGISGLVHIFNPRMILIGGGVSAQETLLMKPLREKILRQVMPRFGEKLEIQSAVLGNDAGLIGAAKFCMDRKKD